MAAIDLQQLNPAQRQAVTTVQGPCLVLAGAGSGKTRVIINKIAYLIRESGYQARQIAAVTFTNKAAREMKARIAQALSKQETRGLLMATFHTLGLEIIKREAAQLGLKRNFSLFDDQDQLSVLKALLPEEQAADKHNLIQLQQKISLWKNQLITPVQALQQAKQAEEQQIAQYYQQYQDYLRACHVVDFDDLILLPSQLLQDNEAVRLRWQTRIRYLLVDEYQDTNSSQYQLIKLLVGERACFTVVGDDDQSIYSWRGARPQNLRLLQQDFPQLQLVKLEQNYRSSRRILRAANILIANNPHVFEKKLHSALGEGEPITVLQADHEEHEAQRVIGELAAHHFLNGTRYGDYAILYRGNHQSRVFEKMLMQSRIPYRISGGTSFFARPEIKDLLAYLRVLTNIDDDNAFLRIANTPKREIGPATLQKLAQWAKVRQSSLLAACHDLGLQSYLSAKAWQTVGQFAKQMQRLAALAEREPVAAVRDLIAEIDYASWLYETSPSAKVAEMKMKNVDQLFSWMTEMLVGDELHEPMNLSQVVSRFTLRDRLSRQDEEQEGDQVQLMTLHASKGLEFPYVFLVGMEEGVLPHQTSIDEDNIEEERRLAYVGITRAQQRLFLSLCRERRQYGGVVSSDASRFLLELPQDDLDWQDKRTQPTAEQRMQKGQLGVAALKAQLAKAKDNK